jgi:hypothetical protein
MCADGETLLHPFPTATALLGGIRWRHRYHSLAGACCLAGEDYTEAIPPGVVDGLVQARLGAAPKPDGQGGHQAWGQDDDSCWPPANLPGR